MSEPSIVVPDGLTLHKENTTYILLPTSNGAFLNPIQEFNRDLSVASIRVWAEGVDHEREVKWKEKIAAVPDFLANKDRKKRRKARKTPGIQTQESVSDRENDSNPPTGAYATYEPVILEALSATGLRSIRYAKEIPNIRYVIANDLSPAAAEAMRRNVEINGLGKHGKVRVNEGDACTLMYSHRARDMRADVVDLDPYGTAAPFLDAAVQCLNDKGLLCVTCTDLAVLAGSNYPEKCFANYGGVPGKAEYTHEMALRLVLNTIATSAARYGRHIRPLLSLSIDFYVRLFVEVNTGAAEVKKLASKTGIYYICGGCQAFHEQPLGRLVESVTQSGAPNPVYKTHSGPPISPQCTECGGNFHLAGPMWTGALHEQAFVSRVLNHVDENSQSYGTYPRMKGMLTVANEELETPFYFTPAKISGFFHCVCPPLDDVASALLHAGYAISRSHACPGSLKTSASRADIYDIFRSWITSHPVKMDKIKVGSNSATLLAKGPSVQANFERHSKSITLSSNVKLVRYQQNPTTHWGPASKPQSGKRKHDKSSSNE